MRQTPSRALGSGDPLAAEDLRAAPLRSLPCPQPARCADHRASRRGPQAGRGGGRARDRDARRRAARTFRTRHRDRAEPRELSSLRIGEQATVEVEVRSVRLRRTRRRGLTIVEATVADDSGPVKAVWFNQPWLAERLREGTRLLLYGKLDRSGLSRRGARIRRRRGRRRNPHHGPRAGASRLRAAPPAADSRLGLAGAAARPARARAAAGGASSSPRAGRRRRRAGGGPLPRRPRRRGARPRAARVRGALPAPGGARGAPAGSPGRPTRHLASAGPASWSSAGFGRCPSSPPATSGARSRRSTPTSLRPADAAAADGGGGLGQDRHRPVRDAARASRRASRPR